MNNNEVALLLIKPDGVRRGLIGEILSRVEKTGIKFTGIQLRQLTAAQARHLYRFYETNDFFPELIEFTASHPVVLVACEGRFAVKRLKNLVGSTDPIQASPNSIRGEFGTSVKENVVHVSDGVRIGREEVDYFF
jgi:nucleoside-diphosphate kinase